VALILLIGFFGLVAWHGLGVVSQSWTSASRSQSALETPTVIPQVLWIAGLAAFVAIGLLLLFDALRIMVSGRSAARSGPDQHALRRGGGRGRDPRFEGPSNARRGTTDVLIVTLAILIGLLALAIPVAAGLGILGLSLSSLYSKLPLSLAMGEIAWGTSNNFLLVAIPFFVLLGEILLRSGMAERMYNRAGALGAVAAGRLMHSNIAACAMFAAPPAQRATAATIGTVALGEVEKRGYSERLFLGTIAAGGTLGILIPPSINMIVYGVLTETSIPKLYLAGFIPGIVLAACSA
jgi:TRAP-type C4-dicarboxylate transport system, large permease component